MNYNARYNKIHKHIILMALFPRGGYKFRYVCRLMSQGIMKASQKPIDTKLTERDWFKAGVRLLIKPLIDEDKAESPDDLNIGDGIYEIVCEGFKKFVKSVRWYIDKLADSDERQWDDACECPMLSLADEFNSAYALLRWIIYEIDGGEIMDDNGRTERLYPQPEDGLLFHRDEKIGVRVFRPWALEGLDEECVKGEQLGTKLVPKAMMEKRAKLENDFDGFMQDQGAGDEVLDGLLDYYETLIPDLPIEGMPMPPPPVREKSPVEGNVDKPQERMPVERNADKKPADPQPAEAKPGIRFTVEAKGDFTVYKDSILGKSYKISNRIVAKKTIDKLIEDLKLDRLEQLYPSWGKVKGQFLRDDAAKFAKDQIHHEPKPGFDERHKSKQFTGRWRLRRDDEIKKQLKKTGKKSKKK